MHSIGVVVADELGDRLIGVAKVLVFFEPDLFDFERFEKAFHEGAVLRTSFI